MKHLAATAHEHDGLIKLVEVDLASVDVRRARDRLAALAHDLEQALHEHLRVELCHHAIVISVCSDLLIKTPPT